MRDLAGTSISGSIDDQGGGGGKGRVAGGVVFYSSRLREVPVLCFLRENTSALVVDWWAWMDWTSCMACYLEAIASQLDANGRSDVCDCRYTSPRSTSDDLNPDHGLEVDGRAG